MLVRLYLNASVYIGQDKYSECAQICENFIAGEYGDYQLEATWDAPFDYTNVNSAEVILDSLQALQEHTGTTAVICLAGWRHIRQENILDWMDVGFNTRFALQPGRDVDSVEYPFELGKPFIKFQKYADDFQIEEIPQLSATARAKECFLWISTLLRCSAGTNRKSQKQSGGIPSSVATRLAFSKTLLREQNLEDKVSNMNHADDNSGVWLVKYPIYPTADPNKLASAYAEIRYAEIYYSLAECRIQGW